MKQLSLIILAAILFTDCGMYYELRQEDHCLYPDPGKYRLLVFSNVCDSVQAVEAVKSFSDSLWHKYYVYADERIQDIDSMPIKPDSIFTIEKNGVLYKIYRFSFRSLDFGDIIDLNNKAILYIDVYFEREQVKFIMEADAYI